MAELRLEVREFKDLKRWQWALLDGADNVIADHEVRLDPSIWQFKAFYDLSGYLSWHVAPDRRNQDEARIAGEVGDWVGEQILGSIAAALVERCPAVVTVTAPGEAQELLLCPLELARVNGRPLSVQDVTFVMQCADMADGDCVKEVGDRLRVLGLFSLPDGGRSLNLRHERFSLVTLINSIRASGKAAEIRVLQYGVTRQRLRAILEETEGWDIIHISGHGTPGELILETTAGRPDHITAAQLADLLRPASKRVKLVTLSACWSAAAEQRRLLGLPVGETDSDRESTHASPVPLSASSLATEVVSTLNCAVLAMRYPVADAFAAELTTKLYELLADKGHPLPRALALALLHLADTSEARDLSVATPALFGASAANLRLAAPERSEIGDYNRASAKMAGFPPPPARFVGRTRVMAEASEALAAESGDSGVLLNGMPGGGKSSCALELAYGHEHAFDYLIWYNAPVEGADITGALTELALTLERALPGFQMAHLVHDASHLASFLPELAELMERYRILLVVDNAESLLDEGGRWREDSWRAVVEALTERLGLGRVILTSRLVPVGETALRVTSVDALTLDEAILLARELPHLHALMRGEMPGVERHLARRLARRTLEAAHGHPKLLELANGQAANPELLNNLLEFGGQVGRPLEDAMSEVSVGIEAPLTPAHYVDVLTAWMKVAAATLVPGDRNLFWVLCCLEESDRIRSVIQANWAEMEQWPDNWADIERRADNENRPPDLDQGLAVIAARGLIVIRNQADVEHESYAVHPVIAASGRTLAGRFVQVVTDMTTSKFWATAYAYASGESDDGPVRDTELMVRAGLAIVPYAIRHGKDLWTPAASILERSFNRAPSRVNAAAMLPALRLIAMNDPEWIGVMARVLRVLDPAASEALHRDFISASVASGNYRRASVSSEQLMYMCLRTGRLDEALAFANQAIELDRQAGTGPWTQLLGQVKRLQVLTAMGHAAQVFVEVQRLRAHMDTLPSWEIDDEHAFSFDVREVLLGTGRNAAIQLSRWEDAIDFSAAQIASKQDRRAPAADIARSLLSHCAPLLAIGRAKEALPLLLWCRQIFQDEHDIEMLGRTFHALATVEHGLAHPEAAKEMERNSLRYSYMVGDIIAIAASYCQLAAYSYDEPESAMARHLAGTAIYVLTGAGEAGNAVQVAADGLRQYGNKTILPTSVDELCRQVSDLPGTQLPALIARLSPTPEAAEQTLRAIIGKVRELAAVTPSGQ